MIAAAIELDSAGKAVLLTEEQSLHTKLKDAAAVLRSLLVNHTIQHLDFTPIFSITLLSFHKLFLILLQSSQGKAGRQY